MRVCLSVKYGLVLSLISALVIGCTGSSNTSDPATESPVAQSSLTATVPASSPPSTTSPSITSQTEADVLKSGSFVSGEHPTEGTVRITRQATGLSLELDSNFKTSEMGPDLVVILHRSPDVIGSTTPPAFAINEGDYVVLAPLQTFEGAQTYAIPETVDLNEYASAAIWCRKFNATFGAAALQ